MDCPEGSGHLTRATTESARRCDQPVLQGRMNNSTNLQVRQHATSFGAVHALALVSPRGQIRSTSTRVPSPCAGSSYARRTCTFVSTISRLLRLKLHPD